LYVSKTITIIIHPEEIIKDRLFQPSAFTKERNQ